MRNKYLVKRTSTGHACPRMRTLEDFSHHLPVPTRSFNTPLYVTTTGCERIAPDQPYPVNKPAFFMFKWEEGRELADFCLAFCTEGSGMLETHAGREDLHAGDGFLFHPGQWHRHRPTRS